MDPAMRHFDTDSLETLVTIVDRGGFTAAGEAPRNKKYRFHDFVLSYSGE